MPLSKEEIENKRPKAEEIIEKYAIAHAGTAFVVGNLGGQFGVDRVPLTALTIKMINDICDLYGIKDNGAKRVHIASAIGRLTIRGTVIASTILNWIPFAGPAANSATTYHLTRKAGQECIRDIERDLMRSAEQLMLAGGRIMAGQILATAADAAKEIVDESAVVIDKACNELIPTTETTDLSDSSNALRKFKEIILSDAVLDSEKEFVKQTFNQYTMSGLSGEDTDLRSMLKRSLAQAVFVAAIDLEDEFLDEHRDKLLKQLEIYRQILPDTTWNSLQIAINDYNNSNAEDRKSALQKLIRTIENSSDVNDEAIQFFRSLCTQFTFTRFKEGLVPFDDGGLDQIRQKLAFIVYESDFSKEPNKNWEVSERLLWSNQVSETLLTHIKHINSGFKDTNSDLEAAIKTTLIDWNFVPESDSFISNCARSIVNDNDLVCAFAVRSLLIKSYVEHCSNAAYEVHLNVSAESRENWLFSEAFSRELLKLSFETKMKIENLSRNTKYLEEAFKRTIEYSHLQSYVYLPHQQLLHDENFVKNTTEMAKLLAADSEPLTTIENR